MAPPRWNLHQILAAIVISLVSLASAAAADASIHHVVGVSSQVRMPRRSLLGMPERQAPRGFPPPQGNALYHNPRKSPPPPRPLLDDDGDAPDRRPPPARIPENARRLAPPPRP